MASSKIVLTFGDSIATQGWVSFDVYNVETLQTAIKKMFFTVLDPRGKKYSIPIQSPTGTPGEREAENYAYYFDLDYNSIQQNFFVTQNLNTVTLIINAATDPFNDLIIQNFTSDFPSVTAVITNATQNTFTLGTVGFTPATNICGEAKISLATGEVAEKIWLNGIQIETSNAANPYLRDIPRGVLNTFILENSTGQQLYAPEIKKGYYVPQISSANVTVKVDQSIIGASLTVLVNQTLSPIIAFRAELTPLTFTYSLNGIDYQASNVFSGQTVGSGTMYVKDQFGCVTQKAYEITAFSSKDPYLFISRANSINFSEYEVWDNQTIFKNDDNTLANQGLEHLISCAEILFNTNDKTKIQFHSNFDTPTVKVRDESGVETAVTLNKRSDNLNRFKAMDGWFYKYADGFLGIYFTAGSTYDELDISNGAFTLNGNLPDFAIKGTFVEIDSLGIFEIVDVVFDEAIQKKAIIVEYVYNSTATQDIIRSVYDILPFEVYEFEIDWSLFGAGVYDVLIDNTDTYNGTVQHLSENIIIADDHENTLAIRYYNDNNRDIFYKYGIEHLIRIPFIEIEGVQLEESEINITDITTSLVNSSVHEANKITFDYITKAEMRKLVIALSCDKVFINGLGYVKNGNCEVEKINNTNLYQVIATMVRTNINYNNNRQGQLGIDDGTIEFDIPPFVFGSGGFVKSI